MITEADVQNVLSHPELIEGVIRGAARALNALELDRGNGHGPDGDDVIMTAKSQLRDGFTDYVALVERLKEVRS